METRSLGPVVITDEKMLDKCRLAMNRWSSKLAFSFSRALGDESQLIRATQYHAYTFSLESKWTHRKFELEKSGEPKSSPVGIEAFSLWDTARFSLDGNLHEEIPETCYRTDCETCGARGRVTCHKCEGRGKTDCDECGGSGEKTCSSCEGSGRGRCSVCGGVGKLYCPTCSGGGKIGLIEKYDWQAGSCRTCGGSQKVICPSCHGSKKGICEKCGGRGKLTCGKCKGRGIITCTECEGKGYLECSDCEGRGWNPWQWFLDQEQCDESIEKIWFDPGLPNPLEPSQYVDYERVELFNLEETEGAHTDQAIINCFDGSFVEELKFLWAESDGKLVMADGEREADRFRYQHAVLTQLDAVIKYEYLYDDKPYIIWIDLKTDKVFEGPEGGLMAEWTQNLAASADAEAAKGNVSSALQLYTKVCSISEENEETTKKICKLVERCSWWFRGGYALTALIWWCAYFATHQSPMIFGISVVASTVFGDWLLMRRKWWCRFLGLMFMLLAYRNADLGLVDGKELNYSGQVEAFFLACSMASTLGFLTLAHDFALRIKCVRIPYRWLLVALGALLGWATSPAFMYGFSVAPESFGRPFAIVMAVVMVGILCWRGDNILYLLNCGFWVKKFKKARVVKLTEEFGTPLRPYVVPALFVAGFLWLGVSLTVGFLKTANMDSHSVDMSILGAKGRQVSPKR